MKNIFITSIVLSVLFLISCDHDFFEFKNSDNLNPNLNNLVDTNNLKIFVNQELIKRGKQNISIDWSNTKLIGSHIEVPFKFENNRIVPTFENTKWVGNSFLIIDNFKAPKNIFIGSVIPENKLKHKLKSIDINLAHQIKFDGKFYLFDLQLNLTDVFTLKNGNIISISKTNFNPSVIKRAKSKFSNLRHGINDDCEPYEEEIDWYTEEWVYEAGEWYITFVYHSGTVWVYPDCPDDDNSDDDFCEFYPWLCYDCETYPWMCDGDGDGGGDDDQNCCICTNSNNGIQQQVYQTVNHIGIPPVTYTWFFVMSQQNCKAGTYVGDFYHNATTPYGIGITPCNYEGTETWFEHDRTDLKKTCSNGTEINCGFSLEVRFIIDQGLKCDLVFMDLTIYRINEIITKNYNLD